MATLFNAAGEYLHRSTAPDCDAAYTFFCRFRLGGTINARITLMRIWSTLAGAAAGNATDWLYVDSDGTLHMRGNDDSGATNFNVSGAALSTGVDYTVFVVRSASNSIDVYLNNGGAAYASSTVANARAVSDRLSLAGSSHDGSNTASGTFTLAMSDPKFWTVAKDGTARTAIHTNGAASDTTSQWGGWDLAAHTDLTDDTGNSRDLTAAGTLSTTTDPVIPSGGSSSIAALMYNSRRRRAA